MRIENDIKAAIRSHAADDYPREACGFVVAVGNKQTAVRCRNVASDPHKFFRMNKEDMGTAEEQGEPVAYYHSHPNLPPIPSMADKTEAEKHKLPCIIVGWPTDAWDFYAPCGWRAELEGRPFVHGILDCLDLFRDYYDLELRIQIPDFEREDDWWKKGQNLYLDNFGKVGFRRVNDLKLHDGILMQIDSPVPNHIAVYLDGGEILHHVQGRLSCRQPYLADRGYYGRASYCVIRHESQK